MPLVIAHIHGGESTEGLIDELLRHSITKLSQIHFTSCDLYKKRIVILCAIDNLVKGASGQAIQNMNLIYGFSQSLGLK